MGIDHQSTTAKTIAPPESRLTPIARLILAWGVTLAVLPYAWGRTLVMGQLTGEPEPWVVALLISGILGTIALTYRLSSAFDRPWLRRWAPLGVAIAWILANGVLIVVASETELPWPVLGTLFVLATLWVPWAAWMYYWPLRWQLRWGVLVLLLAILVSERPVLNVQGLSGDANIIVGWRWNDETLDEKASSSFTGTVDLAPVGDHDYAQFLGPRRLAVLPQARLARDWAKKPPRCVWRKRVGQGWGAFAVVGDLAITQEQRGNAECVICYRVSDGKIVWVHEDAARFDSTLGGPGPRATPTITGERVFTVGATGLLNCLDGVTGKSLWHVNILEDNEAKNIAHGVCASPLVFDDMVVVCPTGRNGISLAAYHRKTRKRLWQAGKDQASYSSPLLAELAGVRQILLYTSEGVTGHDAATGKVLWTASWTNSEQVNCSQPIPNAGGPGQVFVSTGYGKGCALFRVKRSKEDSWSVHLLWKNKRPVMQTKFTTAVLHEGFIYGLDNGILECLDVKTRERRWKAGRYKHGQILLVGNLLLVQAENGEIILVEPSPERLRELGRFPALTGKTWNNPALAGRYLLVRNAREAACYELPVEGK